MVIANKRLTFIIFLLIVAIFIALLISNNETYADIGPKSSVSVTMTNMPTSNYLVTLLNAYDSGGPHTYYEIVDAPSANKDDPVGVNLQNEVKDGDELYFLDDEDAYKKLEEV